MTRRSIGIVFSDGGLLALSAVRPAGAERPRRRGGRAVLCDPDAAPVELREALLSTEYGAGRRAAAGDAGALGRRRGGAAAARRRHPDQLAAPCSAPGLDSEIAFFRWSLEGREGLGHYEVVRARWLRTAGIEVVVSDFGGVLTTPLVESFMAFQDETGISTETLGKAMQAATEANGENPLFEMERGEITEVDFLERLDRRARAAARPPRPRCTASKRSTSRRCSRTRR